ncbi:MAG: hypothetical protein E7377_00805 [Clostridiales bacterium]|nr:hypothetical protein [Clostridiales bacterium]
MFKRKNVLKSWICLLLSLAVLGGTACGGVPQNGGTQSSLGDSSSSSYDETSKEENSSSSSTGDSEEDKTSSGGDEETDSSNNQGGTDVPSDNEGGTITPPTQEDPPLPPTGEVNPEKTVVSEETDVLGHKIVYYSDGTWEDLGRVVALDFAPKAVETRYGYQAFKGETNAVALCSLYEDMHHAAVTFSISEQDITLTDGRRLIAELDCTDYTLSVEEVASVYKTFKQDYPEFFWLAQAASTSYVGDRQAVSFYMCADEAYTQGQSRKALTENVQEMAMECDEYLNGKMSMTERALTIHDYLVNQVTYAYEEDGVTPEDAVWAHNIIGTVYGQGVCETYAKSYAYLCGLFGLECIVVDGQGVNQNGAQAHAWNYLYLDSAWHLVDVTWDDGFETSNAGLITREWFGLDVSATTISHLPTLGGEGMEYQYPLPTLSSARLIPVAYGEELGETEMVSSPEAAFAKMVNGQGRYEMKLYPDTNVTLGKGLVVYPVGAYISNSLPAVKDLIISAKKAVLGEGYILPKLTANGSLTLKSNVVLEDVSLDALDVNLNGHDLCTTGFWVDLNVQNGVVGDAESSLTVATSYMTAATKLNVSAVKLCGGEWGLTLKNGGTIGTVKGFGGSIWLDGKQALTVGSFLKGEETVVEVGVYVNFNSAEEYPQFSVMGECDVCVAYHIRGTIDGQYALPTQLPATLLKWSERTLADLRIYFVEGGYLYDRTADYSLTGTGAVVYQ